MIGEANMLPIAKILLPVDFSERACHAAPFAILFAEHFQSEIVLAHVLPPHYDITMAEMGSGMLDDLLAQRRERAERSTREFLGRELAHLRVRRLLLEGDPAREIVACARGEQANLIMMPTHGYGPFRRMLLGSVTAKVLHDADCPVWTATHMESAHAGSAALRHILCAIDLKPGSAGAIEWSVRVAAEFGAKLTLVHSLVELDPRTEEYHYSPEWRQFLIDAAQREIAALQKEAGTSAEVRLTLGPADKAVCEDARAAQADLLVIGRGLEAGVLGRLTSDAYAIIRQSPCPVVSV